MSSEWPTLLIGELAAKTPGALAVGPFGSRMKADLYAPSGVRVIRGNNLGAGLELKGDFVHVPPLVADGLASCCLVPGDLVFPHRGNIGEVGITPDDEHRYMLSTSLMKLSPDRTRVDPLFLTYYFKSNIGRAALLMNASQVGTPGIATPLKSLRSIELPLPTLAEQQVISRLLSELDNRITLLRETNATLETIAQALFKSWFVDFDPVRAKRAGLAPEGMDEATAALFPDAFAESALGLVPKGWALTPFGQLLTRTIGGDWGSDVPDEKNDTRVAIVRGTDIPDLQTGAASRVPIRYTSLKKLASRRIEEGDIVLEVSGGSKDQPTGRALFLTKGLLHQFDCPVEPASFCRLLRPATREIGILLSQHLAFIYAEGKTWEYQNQSTGIANFQTTHFLEKELVAMPPQEVLTAFVDLVRPLVERTHTSHIRELTGIRDTLLPRLISGQLRLPEAQHQIEEATA
jgi:type I restriction enzyme, S subunit